MNDHEEALSTPTDANQHPANTSMDSKDEAPTITTMATTWPIRRPHHGISQRPITTQRPTYSIAPRPKPQRQQRQPPVGSGQPHVAP
eukprot:12907301-Prorocentrum_lima.AAC.1